ncbi:MAG: TonB-dependent receptor domain-containing protein [Marinilabiliaceae bacterium]
MKKLLTVLALCAATLCVSAQGRLTREQILAMSTEQLSELPLDELMQAVETLGVSSVDELFALIMNKNVSSASKEEEQTFISPLSSTVITRDEMRSYGVSSIEEAFRLIPGMIVSEKTNGVYDVQMRGLSNIPDNNMLLYTENANILVMVDGRVAHNYAIGATFFETLPVSIEDVERIEVVRGASSALYGPNAVNGVINIITEKPDAAQKTVQGDLQIGNRTTLADFGFRKNLGAVSLGLTANYQLRKRKNSSIPFIPQDGFYVVNDLSALANGSTLSSADFNAALASGKIDDISSGADLSVAQIERTYTASFDQSSDSYTVRPFSSEEVNIYSQWPEPDLARRSAGVNGYVSFTPSPDVRIDAQGGFQYAFYATTPIGNESMALRYRKSQTGYANISARIHGLSVLANYSGGPMKFAVGSQGFDMDETHIFNAQADYDFHAGPLDIRPGVSYQFVKYKDARPQYYDYGNGPEEMSGYWGYYSKGMNSANLKDIAPSLRLDYKVGGFRAIVAARVDKTNIPDKWNTSWQVAANYLFNDNNFLRLTYGRSFRSAALANTSSNFNWSRANGSNPRYIQFLGNEDAPLMHIDNFEVGYRWRPTPRVLVDLEAFYSRSTDYGELKSNMSNVYIPGNDLSRVMMGVMTGQLGMQDVATELKSVLNSKSYIKYDEVPFVVHQMGVGLNVDWIISSKLIAKVNANIQRTTIDNYYQYSQSDMIMRQLVQSMTAVSDPNSGIVPLVSELFSGAMTAEAANQGGGLKYINDCMGYTSIHDPLAKYEAMGPDQRQAYLQSLVDAYNGGPAVDGVERPLGLYYALKYNVRYNSDMNEYYLGTSVAEPYKTSDNYRHKAAPSVYGMVGLIYRPTSQWNVAAFANVIGKRSYTTLFGTAEVDPRCTVNLKIGYKPTEQCEVFFNAHNLFNTNKQEFVYTDKIGGIYTVGVNFGV